MRQILCSFLLLVLVDSQLPGSFLWAQTAQEIIDELKQLRAEAEQRRAELLQQVTQQRSELEREIQLLRDALGTPEASQPVEVTEISEPVYAAEVDEAVAEVETPSHETMSQEELEAELETIKEDLQNVREQLATKNEEGKSAAVQSFKLKGQVRTRFEWIDNDFASGDANMLHLLRTRLGISAAPHEHTSVFVQLQDSRNWGEETSTLADGSGDNIDFHQAYIKVDFSGPLALTLGRQEMVYGGQRLIGAVGWHNIGRAFDAVKLRYGSKSYVDLFNAKLAEKGVKDRNFYGLYGHLAASGHAWEPYLLFEHDKNGGADERQRFTVGVHANGRFNGSGPGLGFELETAFQTGELGAQDVAAFMGTGALSYYSDSWRKHKFTLGVDYLSGDDDPADGDYKVFDTLFATNHKFYGFMDFFLNIPVHTGQGGLLDIMLKGEMKTAEKTKLAVHLHHFALAQGKDKGLGQELDAVLTHSYNKAYSIQLGGLFFLPGDAMEALKGGDDPAFKLYLQTLANF